MASEHKAYDDDCERSSHAVPILGQVGTDGTVSDAALTAAAAAAAAAQAAAAGAGAGAAEPGGAIRRARIGPQVEGVTEADSVAEKTVEIGRRQAIVVNPGPVAVLPAELALKRRADFEREYSGFGVVNFANAGFTTRCSEPNLRLLSQHIVRDHFNPQVGFNMERQMAMAYEDAQNRVFTLLCDPRVKSPGVIVPLNKPTLIPYSEATARSARHTLEKIERSIRRHREYTEHRNAEFARRQAECRDNDGIAQTLPELGTSEFSRRQLFLRRQELLRKRAAGENVDEALRLLEEETRPVVGGVHPIPGVNTATPAPDARLLSEVAANVVATAAASDGKVVQGGIGLASGSATSGLGTSLGLTNAAATVEDLRRMGVAQDDPLLAMFTNPHAAPPAVISDAAALPKHWQPNASGGGNGSGTETGVASDAPGASPFVPASLFGSGARDTGATAATPSMPSAGAPFPVDLMLRGKFMTLWYMDDLDTPEDDPEFPEAAGKEPTIILFGGAQATEAEAKAHNKDVLGPFCSDLTLDTVDMYEWLYPTQVDPNKIEEEYRTTHSAFTNEQNLIGRQRKHNIALSARARETYAATGAPLAEINANARGLPNVEDARNHEAPISIGSVVTSRDTGTVEARAAVAEAAAAASAEAMAAVLRASNTR